MGDWTGHGLTMIGFLVTLLVLAVQLRRQHQSSLELQRENAQEALKLKVYEMLSDKASAFVEADSEAQSYARKIIQALESQLSNKSLGINLPVTELRSEAFMGVHFRASTALTDVFYAIEKWGIAFPLAKLFRIAFSSSGHEVDEAFNALFMDITQSLPVDLGGVMFLRC